jgi:hypothetical protein
MKKTNMVAVAAVLAVGGGLALDSIAGDSRNVPTYTGITVQGTTPTANCTMITNLTTEQKAAMGCTAG